MQYEFLLWLRLVLPQKRYMPSWKSSGSLLYVAVSEYRFDKTVVQPPSRFDTGEFDCISG